MAGREHPRLKVGISACLLGQKVRYDGGHKSDDFLVGTLSRFVRYVPVCPEVELGLGTPREPIHLERRTDGVHLVGVRSHEDHTAAMTRYAAGRAEDLVRDDLAGYVFKKDSPSCGMERVRVFGRAGGPSRDGRGVFADEVMKRFPLLPVEEEGRLQDAGLRRSFLVRLYAGRRLRELFRARWTRGDLVAFHSREKLLLLAHEPEAYRDLGRLVARVKELPRAEFVDRYERRFMEGLARVATRGRHANVLQHIAGYFKDSGSAEDRLERASAIDEYRRGLVPLEAPLLLLRHYVRRSSDPYLRSQTYLDPFPRELVAENG
jgi:uncharacterized protein YbgA (DUF1722 family)/uncharacterized protein YbbK (DUF523 family)